MFAFFGYMNPSRPATEEYDLEVLSARPKRVVADTPLLFVHGAHMGAWCWDEYFLPYFAERGYHAHAVSLRGHAKSAGREQLNSFGIADYAQDLATVAARFDRPPVLVGHSMGGVVVQKYLEEHAAAGAVLMASVPPNGLSGSVTRLLMTQPSLLMRMGMIHAGRPTPQDLDVARRTVFSEHLSEEELRRYARGFQPESNRAIWDMTVGGLPRRWRIRPPPMLVLGGEQDALFSPAMVRATARAYGTEAEIFPNMCHGMMLEHGWRSVADRIIDWLREEAIA